MKNLSILLFVFYCMTSFSSCAWLLAMSLGMNGDQPSDRVERPQYELEEDMIEIPAEGWGDEMVEPPPPPPPMEEEPPLPPPRMNRSKSDIKVLTLTATKMNVFYIGVDNPVEISVPDFSSNQLKVSCTGCMIKSQNGKYTVTVQRPLESVIHVSTPDGRMENFKFRAKRIPDPVPVLGAGPNKKGGPIGNGEFKAQMGLAGLLEQFDFDARCKITGFELTKLRKGEAITVVDNQGARYNDQTKALIQSSKPGDTYLYNKIKCKCPGDAANRLLNSTVFNIK